VPGGHIRQVSCPGAMPGGQRLSAGAECHRPASAHSFDDPIAGSLGRRMSSGPGRPAAGGISHYGSGNGGQDGDPGEDGRGSPAAPPVLGLVAAGAGADGPAAGHSGGGGDARRRFCARDQVAGAGRCSMGDGHFLRAEAGRPGALGLGAVRCGEGIGAEAIRSRPSASRSASANSPQLACRCCTALASARANTLSAAGGSSSRRDVSRGGGSDTCA
jgi:hypothetical protein